MKAWKMELKCKLYGIYHILWHILYKYILVTHPLWVHNTDNSVQIQQ